jgi:hypothetical protein
MKNNIMKFLSVIVFILCPVIISLAQPLPNGLGPNGLMPDGTGTGLAPTLSCPIGSGYWILLALALSYGAYKAWQMRKVEKTA